MIFIRGKVEPGRTNLSIGAIRSLFGSGRWDLTYVIRDQAGERIKEGAFKADSNGHFTLGVDAPTPATVEIRVVGESRYAGDCCRVEVCRDNDLINLPRKLNPLGALQTDTRRVASL